MVSFFENSPGLLFLLGKSLKLLKAFMGVVELIDDDTDGKFLLVNPTAEKMCKKSKEELLKSSLVKTGLPRKILNSLVKHCRCVGSCLVNFFKTHVM